MNDRVEYWIRALGKMEDRHCPDLDHKDCGEIAEILEEMQNLLIREREDE
jgi:hypothetical protein